MAGFVSFSLTHEDCSWYAGCSMMAVGGYESARLKPPIALRSGLPAPPVVSIVPDWRNATVTTHTTGNQSCPLFEKRPATSRLSVGLLASCRLSIYSQSEIEMTDLL